MERSETSKNNEDFIKETLPYNPIISEKEKRNPRHKIFLDWCFDNGLKWTGVDFPAYFGENGELRGLVATRDIEPYEIVLAVPNQLLITSKKVREEKQMMKIIEENDEYFDEEDQDQNCLKIFLLREKAKGSKSFYAPFINIIPEFDTSLVWDKEIIDFIEDESLKQEIIDAQRTLKLEYETLKPILAKYPDIFPK